MNIESCDFAQWLFLQWRQVREQGHPACHQYNIAKPNMGFIFQNPYSRLYIINYSCSVSCDHQFNLFLDNFIALKVKMSFTLLLSVWSIVQEMQIGFYLDR